METIYILFFAVIGIIIAIGIGLEISKGIDEFIIYVLFWILYIITIITFINIVLVSKYYLNLKDKKGPVGKKGKIGERGDKGDTGLCDPKCRDSICENSLNEMIINELKDKNKGVDIKINNIYIKSKIRQMCASDEFKQLAPYNGPLNLINYVKAIWKIWFDLIYDAGGIKYFQNIGAETEFEWLNENPFDELKKYDLFYWGMGKQYRPQIIDKCYNSIDGVNPSDNTNSYIIRTSKTNYYEKIGDNSGTESEQQLSFWRAKEFTYKTNVFYPVGDIVIGPNRKNDSIKKVRKIGEFTIQNNQIVGPDRQTLIVSGDVKPPVNYILIWTNKGERGNNFWIWRPIAPAGYIALGHIFTSSELMPLTGEQSPIRCVPKEITEKLPSPQTILWSSKGMRMASQITLLGYQRNKGVAVNATDSNAYNVFRAIEGINSTYIAEDDENNHFYKLNPEKYDVNFTIGIDNGNPDTSNSANSVGKGYIKSKKKDSKYSVMPYLNLKNKAMLTHDITKKKVEGELIPNAISNAYLIKNDNKCLNFVNNRIKENECDELIDTQIFSIIFTGNKKNECQIQNYKSKKYIKYKNGIFTLINENDKDEGEHTLFIME